MRLRDSQCRIGRTNRCHQVSTSVSREQHEPIRRSSNAHLRSVRAQRSRTPAREERAMTDEFRLYTYKEAAAILRVSESLLRKAVAAGAISCRRSPQGRLVRFTEEDLRTAFRPVAATRADPATSRRRTRRRRAP
ncbi:helix-turn-helix domain-containing protein [Dactylosporangium darangshiense]|uniref:helix-turn-helix domain-containing protein n=1 Tax=Dactylosporangium darangshiense TaxID=579108 RepID=UPI003642B3C5